MPEKDFLEIAGFSRSRVDDLVVDRSLSLTPAATALALTSPILTTPAIGAATGVSLALTGGVAAYNATAVPAGGTAGVGLKVSSTANLGVFFGSGAPTLLAAKGSLYLRTDGSGVDDRMYVATDAIGGWASVTTAS